MEKIINEFSVGLFFWQLVLFLLLLFLLKRFAWDHILTSVKNREDSIKEGLASAEEAKQQMRQLKRDNQDLLAEARKEKEEILKSAREAKEQMIADSKAKAKEEGDKMISNAKEVIRAERSAAVNELKSQVADLSIQIAEKIIKSELSSDAKQKDLIASAMKNAELN